MKRLWPLLVLILLVSCAEQEARRPVSVRTSTFYKESAERNKKMLAEQQAYFNTLFAKDSLNEYIASQSGFWYRYDVKDTTSNVFPKEDDLIKLNFDLKDHQSKIIYSKEEIGIVSYKVDKQQKLPQGLRDAVKLMRVGETMTFYFPSILAYGHLGDKNRIGYNTPIISTVTLIEIQKPTLN